MTATLPPIFSPHEREQNEDRKHRLMELICAREALLMVGAGSSRRVGHELWTGLLTSLEELARDCGGNFTADEAKRLSQPLQYAESLRDYVKAQTGSTDRFYALIDRLYRPKMPPCDSFHQTLVSLPFRGIITVNYDTVLEAALAMRGGPYAAETSFVVGDQARPRISEFFLSLDTTRPMPRRVAHLHGIYDRADTIILCEQDYMRAYNLRFASDNTVLEEITPAWTMHRQFLWTILASRRVVLVGFSMTDPYLNMLLEVVTRDLWRFSEPVHYAVMSISPKTADPSKEQAKRFRERYAVDVVFYENIDGQHSGLESLVAEIADHCDVAPYPAHQTIEPKQPPSTNVEEGHAEAAEQGVTITPGKGWAGMVTRRMIGRMTRDEC